MRDRLIRLDDNGLMLRPTSFDLCVRRRAAEIALPQVKGWLGSDLQESDAELIDTLAKHMRRGDGYEIAQTLERDGGWQSDSYLVEIFDEDFVGQAESEMVRQWVQCIRPAMPFSVGDLVNWKGEHYSVCKLMPEEAKYGVRIDGMQPNSYYVVNVEDLKATIAAVA